MKNKVLEIHQSWKTSDLSKVLCFQEIVRATIHKIRKDWRDHASYGSFLLKLLQDAISPDGCTTGSTAGLNCLSQGQRWWFNNKKDMGQKWHPWDLERLKLLHTKKEQSDPSHLAQNIKMIQNFGVEFLKGVSQATKLHLESKRKQMGKRKNMVVLVWQCWTSLLVQDLDNCHNWLNQKFWFLEWSSQSQDCKQIKRFDLASKPIQCHLLKRNLQIVDPNASTEMNCFEYYLFPKKHLIYLTFIAYRWQELMFQNIFWNEHQTAQRDNSPPLLRFTIWRLVVVFLLLISLSI